ncbi:MAG: hypothetical protein AUJ52_07130 [Elusimicrobia bacterium CG1_02_63_36]|nr:MAG: hypothetical protein AUJ52_07130 [Elusimicrobia bacterium CG1_02_63_36]PIP84701.1 MAG: hypothetical protein COR54_02630 [Elusimicrobia bacterium CG22_combo_CG10-13_8_21_14_all_63_91]PJA13714.1 MAG: hypothetical protein COX66_14320 [Elusimicrobia bacterium CG_4_10_14_0_2_um_filter_63_34]PJB23165.1 MAG: hypothetical protein CO113_18990 [Elusimicrobia bacterium CG_4_9_14_3_um_filter_62_55]
MGFQLSGISAMRFAIQHNSIRVKARVICAAAAICTASPFPAGAIRPIRPPAPEFPRGSAWINSTAFTMSRLRDRRVVLIAFINSYSLNSVRTLSHLNRWWNLYGMEGLMVIGIHSPDFDFDRDPLQATKAIQSAGIKFPVLIDNRKLAWNAYRNEGWPAYYLVDHEGRVVHDQLGEGRFAEFEEEILRALNAFNGYKPPENYRIPREAARDQCAEATPSLFLGGRRGKDVMKIEKRRLQAITKTRDGELAVMGRWVKDADALRYAGTQKGFTDMIRLIYQGAESAAVISHFGDKPARVFVKQDNLWLHGANANVDIQWDEEDRSFVLIDRPKLFFLTKNKQKDRMHELFLYPSDEGVAVSAFEFSDHCEINYEKPGQEKKTP